MDVVTSPTSSSLTNSDDQEAPLLNQLRRRALQYARPSRREQTLIRMLQRPTERPPATPREFREVLRRPSGKHHLVVQLGGRPHGLVLNAQGQVNPAREDYLWSWLIARVQQRGTE